MFDFIPKVRDFFLVLNVERNTCSAVFDNWAAEEEKEAEP